MRRRKAEDVPVVPTATDPAAEGVIDLDPDVKTEYQVPPHVGETVVLQPEQTAVKHRRIRRTRVTVTPLLVDHDAIRKAQIATFVEFLDGKRTEEAMLEKVRKYTVLANAADDLQGV